jgi:hypothetical protein
VVCISVLVSDATLAPEADVYPVDPETFVAIAITLAKCTSVCMILGLRKHHYVAELKHDASLHVKIYAHLPCVYGLC